MEYNNSLLLQQIERQLRYIPRYEPDDTGFIKLGHLGESYMNELTVLKRLLQGILTPSIKPSSLAKPLLRRRCWLSGMLKRGQASCFQNMCLGPPSFLSTGIRGT